MKQEHWTTQEEANKISELYEKGQTLTYAAIITCNIPHNAEDIRFKGDIFSPNCLITYTTK